MASTIVRNFIAKGLFKKKGAIANNKAVEFSANALEQRLKNFGIDPNAIQNENELNQILSAVKQAEDAAFSQQFGNMLGGSKFDRQGEVFDMTGKKLDSSRGIMGGTQIDEKSLKEGLMKTDNPFSDLVKTTDQGPKTIEQRRAEVLAKRNKEPINEKFIDFTIQDINKKDPLEGMKIANKIIKREGEFKDLTEAQSQRILKETDDHLTGKDTDYDPQDFYATGGRIGLKGGLSKAFIEFLKNTGKNMNNKSPLQFGKDYLKNVKDKTLKANKTGKFMDLPIAEVGIPATTGALVNNQVKKKLEAMNEEQKEQNLKEFIMELENDEFYQKYPDLKDETIASYTEKLFGEKKADGGRIGLKGGMTKRAFMKLMGGVGASIGAAKSGIFSGFGKGATKQVAKEVVQQSTTTPPPYFFELANKIKKFGTDTTPTNDRTIAKSMKSKDGKSDYILEEDVTSGDTIIKKVNKEGDNMITDVQMMELKKGEIVGGKDGKAIRTADEYEEVTETNSRIYKDNYNASDYVDGIEETEIKKIIDEASEQAPSIKKAGGGIARMLGE